jgi:hypothetical protein
MSILGRIVYEFHEMKQSYQISGGHLHCDVGYTLEIDFNQYNIDRFNTFALNASTGVSFRDWLMSNSTGKCIDHKSSTVFPPCFNRNFWSGYVSRLLANNPDDGDICCYDSGKRVQEKEGVFKRQVIFKHPHYVGCKDSACSCDQNSVMYVTAIIREEVIDLDTAYDLMDSNDSNILRSVISLYPMSVYCLDYDKYRGGFLLNREVIENDEYLNRLLPNFFDYQRQENIDQGLVYNDQGVPLYQSVLFSLRAFRQALQEAAKKLSESERSCIIAGNIDSSIIEITEFGIQYVLVKVAQGVFVRIQRDQLNSMLSSLQDGEVRIEDGDDDLDLI